jgi:YHS domain-containing protein
MIWLLRLAALVAAFYLLRELVRWAWRNLFAAPAAPPQPSVRRGTVRRDPVCGTYVDVEVSVQAQEDGEVLHFCSTRCRDAYYARQSTASAAH